MRNFRAPTQEQTGILIAMLAVIFGGWVRLFIPSIAGFPVNDGGLFYVMVRAIQENGLRLPPFIQYNGLNIPFAYPPLAFFIGAIISNLFHVDPIEILRWLPAIVLIGTIPAFYGLAEATLDSPFKAGIATLMFAFTPRAIMWQIMGGGLTRSFGLLFLLLALACIYRLFVERDRKYLALSIVFSALVVVTHPEATIQAIGFGLLFWIFKGRNKDGALNAILVGAGTIALTTIWWMPLLLHFGLTPFLAAAQTGSQSILGLLYPIFTVLTNEPLMTLIAVLGLIGLATRLAQKDYLLPAAYILPFLVEPRSSPTYAMIPLAMLASIAISDVILPAFSRFENKSLDHPLQSHTAQGFMLFVGFYLLGSTFYFGTQIAATAVSRSDREAFDWVRANTPIDSHFVILTGDLELFGDSTQEWFPALTDRISLTTIQGKEWLEGKTLYSTAAGLQAIQQCTNSDVPLTCIESQTKKMNQPYDYIYIARKAASGALILGLNQDSNYELVYETQGVVIFIHRP